MRLELKILTPSATPIHDETEQYRGFLFLSYILDPTSRLSVIGSTSVNDFQIPNKPGVPAGTGADGVTQWIQGYFNSVNLNENQR